MEDTIAAIATPAGSGGIGIVKISGIRAIPVAASLFRPFSRNGDISLSQSHRLHYGHIADDKGQIIDEVLVAVMKAPHSYTGEDVVEIQAHAGPLVLKRILELVSEKGVRLAMPGEFTRRAFSNGRIDLTQAEAVMDLISAKSVRSLDIAAAQLGGGIRNEIGDIRESLLRVLSAIEAGIDFPEDVGDGISAEQVSSELKLAVIPKLEDLISRYHDSHVLRDGLKVLVTGRPNVGKSSLMNRLLRRDRMIVTPIPGTTRDLIEESLSIRGIPIILADSAGLHESENLAEQIGMEKTRIYIEEADMILFMLDATDPMTRQDADIYEKIRHKPLIVVINKSDLATECDLSSVSVPGTNPGDVILISALLGNNIETLKDRIAHRCLGKPTGEHCCVPSLRHKIALEKSLEFALSASEGLKENLPFELVGMDIAESLNALDEITGQNIGEDVLDRIFERFCIGK